MKKRIIQFHVYRGDTEYIAEGVDVAIVTQAASLDKLTQNIEEAVALHFDGEDMEDLGFSDQPAVQVNFELASPAHA